MREIKFRAWDKVKKEYLYSDKFPSMWQFFKELENRGIRHWEVEQFTGLKDKKRTEEYPEGQEIYEGDIVNHGDFAYNDVKSFGEKPWENLPENVKENDITRIRAKFNVEWDYGFLFMLEGLITDNPDISGVEIIGTIHDKEQP